MSLFGAIVRTAVNAVAVPLAVVADAATLCDGANPDGGFTSRAIEKLKEEAEP